MDIEKIDLLEQKMLLFHQHDPMRIQHLVKVHRFAQMIGRMEHLDKHMQFITEYAALVHDIGILPAEEKFGSSNGKLQEQEGPAYAHKMLKELCFSEADFLVNFYEDHMDQHTIQTFLRKIFQTNAGKKLCRVCYFKN